LDQRWIDSGSGERGPEAGVYFEPDARPAGAAGFGGRRGVNGVHDMGGMHGFGPVVREENEPVFHADWERHVYAMSRATRTQGLINIDESRYGIERMPPAEYLAASYYERWLASLERNLIEKGVLSREEIEARTAYYRQHPEADVPRREAPPLAEQMLSTLRTRPRYRQEPDLPPRFKVGQAVLARNEHPTGHTRLPRYARGKRGTINLVHGTFIFPDSHAHGRGEQPQPLYSVRFEASELWAHSAEPREAILLDLWESYLEPARGRPGQRG
jgi:nitrile hydratase